MGRLIAERYRLVQNIGSGAMGIVWQAHDERLHRTVALKQLLLQPGLSIADAEEARNRAMREGRIAARLQHPNAVTVYDVVDDEGQPVLIMEYVPSRSLSAVLEERGSLPPIEVARIGEKVATALTAAHAAGIVHRDIKPGNVLLAENGDVKITDFGISRATGDVSVTATGMLAGTPAYLAPEVAKGEVPGPPSDVFSLGSTLYAAVEGQPPFGNSDNTLAVLHAVAACRTEPPRQAGPLTALLMQMLRGAPEERPNMVEITQALGAIAAGQVPAPPAPALAAATPTVPVTPRTPPRPVPPPPMPPQPMHQTGAQTRLDARPLQPPMQPPMDSTERVPYAPPRAPRQKSELKKWLLTALAIIAAAVIGILIANMFVNTSGNNQSAASTPSLASVSSSTGNPAPTTTVAPPTETAPTTQQSAAPPAAPSQGQQAAEMRNVLQEYYSLLPHSPGSAWQLLSPSAQAGSGDLNHYQQVWTQYAATQVYDIKPASGNSLLARVRLTKTDGSQTDDPYVFTFVPSNGTVLINSASLVGKPSKPTKPGKPGHQ
jgi:hypothetical protein